MSWWNPLPAIKGFVGKGGGLDHAAAGGLHALGGKLAVAGGKVGGFLGSTLSPLLPTIGGWSGIGGKLLGAGTLKSLGGAALAGATTFGKAWAIMLSKVYGFTLPKLAVAIPKVGGFLGGAIAPLGAGAGKLLGAAGSLGWKLLGGIAAAGLAGVWLLNKVTGAPRALQRRVVRVTGIGGGRGRHSMTTIMETSSGGSSGHGVGKLALIGLLLFGWWAAPAAFPQPAGQSQLMRGYHVQQISSGCAGPVSLPSGGATGIVAELGAKIHGFSFTPPSPAADLQKAHDLITRLGRLWRTFTDAKANGTIPTDPAVLLAQPGAVQAAACCPASAPADPAAGITVSLPTAVSGPGVHSLTLEQTNNARTIVSVGAGIGVPAAAEVIAVAVALQESSLVNLPGGGLDSAGLFQQRPSQGWGTYAQVTDPVFASTTFYTRLLAVPGWQQMPLTVAAQAVQRSGFPDAYARWQTLAGQLVAGAGGAAPVVGQAAFIPVCTAPVVPVSGPVSPSAQTAIAFAMGQIGKPYAWGAAGPNSWDCSGLVGAAFRLAPVGTHGPSTFTLINMGVAVPPGQEQPGDVVLPDAGHSGIVISPGIMVDAPHTGAFVRVEPYSTPWAIRRLSGAGVPA